MSSRRGEERDGKHLSVVLVVLVLLGVLVLLSLVALGGLGLGGWSDPSISELKDRLRVIGGNRALATPAPGATLTDQNSVLCADSSSPYYIWHYRYAGTFDSVVAFYSDRLPADGWERGTTSLVGNVGFTKRHKGWTADGVLERDELGYSLFVSVDDGYESGCG